MQVLQPFKETQSLPQEPLSRSSKGPYQAPKVRLTKTLRGRVCVCACLRLGFADGGAVVLGLRGESALEDGEDALNADADAHRWHVLAAEHAHQAVVPGRGNGDIVISA